MDELIKINYDSEHPTVNGRDLHSVLGINTRYADKGYTSTKTHNYLGNDGEYHSRVHTYWTQKGRLFIYEFMKQNGVYPLIEQEECNGEI